LSASQKVSKPTPKKGEDIELEIESTAFKGKGVGHINGMAIFVPNTAPGDLAKVRIVKRKKKYCEGKLLNIIKPGEIRIEPTCRHAMQCGGCTWQQLPYDYQLQIKQQQVGDHMKRIGNIKTPVNKTVPANEPFYYRNKMEYSFGTRRWLSQDEVERDEFVSDKGTWAGLHAPGRFDKILNIHECHLQAPISYNILEAVREYIRNHDIAAYDTIEKTGFMRNVVIRNAHYTDDLMVNLVTFKDKPDIIEPLCEFLLDSFPAITTIVNNINDRPNPTAVGRYQHIMYGPGYITEKNGGFSFKIHANAFFQTNTQQAEKLYSIARNFAEIDEHDLIYDLYCGVGTLSLYLSNQAKQVVGIELNKAAIKNARYNTSENNVNNTAFVQGDMKDVFTHKIIQQYGSPDCIITDPPRAGMHGDVIHTLSKIKVPKLVYISCNSSTMARDLKLLNKSYEILEIQPVDMFPQTYHIETVAKLRAL